MRTGQLSWEGASSQLEAAQTDGLILLGGDATIELLAGRELEIIEAVRQAYLLWDRGEAASPNCPFLRIPGNTRDRIIPKPAYLGGKFQTAGIKWIASFPDNTAQGMDRASAVMVLNSAATGQPQAILEGSVISSYRTAASAALAGSVLYGSGPLARAGLLGCGPIQFETLRFLIAARPEVEQVSIFDPDPSRAAQFERKIRRFAGGREVRTAPSAAAVFDSCQLVSLATNQTTPHLDLHTVGGGRREGPAVILHVSLRDLLPEVIRASINVVDDIDQACSNRTSLDLAALESGNRDFISATIGSILSGRARWSAESSPDGPGPDGSGPDGTSPDKLSEERAHLSPATRDRKQTVIFSPFGLGILDVAVGHLAANLARAAGAGTPIGGFLPTPWADREDTASGVAIASR